MYKRRDWLLLHGPDGGDSSSEGESESGDGDGAELVASGSDSGEESDDDDSEEGGDEDEDDGGGESVGLLAADGAPRHIQDISEDDYEDGESEGEEDEEGEGGGDGAQLSQQLRLWLESTVDSGDRGPPLRCITCPTLPLLLNARNLQSHVASKRHRKLAAASQLPAEKVQHFCFANAVRPNGEAAETHTERHRRVTAVTGGKGEESDKSGKRRKRKGKKLGKRQREAAKLAGDRIPVIPNKATNGGTAAKPKAAAPASLEPGRQGSGTARPKKKKARVVK